MKMFNLLVSSILLVAFRTGTAANFDSRIIGGNDANILNIPYQLSLRNMGSHLCGASIIASNWALTSAQCVDGVKNPEIITLISGSSLLSNGGKVHEATEIYKHPKYNIVYKDYDLALIKIKDSFSETAIPLSRDNIPAGALCTVSGWGYITQNGGMTDHLQVVEVPVVANNQCRNYFPNRPITERNICAGVSEGGRDSCNGDTGGPLVYNGHQVGIISWRQGCALPNKPGVYTNVATFQKWIQEITGI